MRTGYFVLIGFVCLFLFSCSTEIVGEGGISTQTYTPASNFTKVSVDDDIDVRITYGTTKKIHVTGYDNLLENVKITATGGVLRIGMKPDYTYTNMNISAQVIMPSFTELSVTHAGNIEIDSFANDIPNLSLIVSGSGNVTALHHPNIGNLTANLSNSGSADINGHAKNQYINLTGTGNFTGFDCGSNTSTINITGAGNAEVSLKLLLTANISGSGNVYYKRYPDIVSTITGTGAVIDAN